MKIKHTGVAVGLLLLLIFVYWPGIVGNTAMKWDATAIYLPWKLFLSRSVFSGNLPLWNPFTMGGFPQCMDPGTWYPISYFFGWGGVYDLQRLLNEYLFHVWLSGVGLYVILIKGGVEWRIAGVLSAVFLFNGFFVGNAQHLGWIVAASWSIWSIFWFQMLWDRFSTYGSKVMNSQSTSAYLALPVLGLGLSMFFLLTGGYPGMFLIQCYVLAFWSIWNWFSLKKDKRVIVEATVRFWSFIVFLIFTLMALPAIMALLSYLPYITRSAGLQEGALMFGSFPMICALDWLVPISWLELGEAGRDLGDISMIDGFWSRLGMWAIIVLLFFRSSRKSLLPYLAVGLIFWLFSMGKDLPFKTWLNQWAVGMDYFRFPAQFRFWGMLFWMIALGKGLMALHLPKWLANSSLQALVALVFLAESTGHGFTHRFATVFSNKDEYVDAAVVKSTNAFLSLPLVRIPRNIDTISLRKWDGPHSEPLNNLWYNRGILLAELAIDGYNPYAFQSIASPMWDTSNATTFSDSLGVRGAMRVSSSLWRIREQILVNNNEMACSLDYLGDSSTYAMAKNDFLLVRQLSVPGWKCRFRDGTQCKSIPIKIDPFVGTSDCIRIPLKDLLLSRAGGSSSNYKDGELVQKFQINLVFSPEISLAGFTLSLVEIAVVSWFLLGLGCLAFCFFIFKEFFKR